MAKSKASGRTAQKDEWRWAVAGIGARRAGGRRKARRRNLRLSSPCSPFTSRICPSKARARPKSLQGPGENPQLKVNVNVNARPAGGGNLRGRATARGPCQQRPRRHLQCRAVYGGLFRLRGVPENLLQPVLFVDCPTILFPFVRRVLSDAIRDGGFPPLMLDPIDFAKLYAQNFKPAAGDLQASAKN